MNDQLDALEDELDIRLMNLAFKLRHAPSSTRHRAIEDFRRSATAAFIDLGESDLEAFIRADSIANRFSALLEREAAAAAVGAQRRARPPPY